MMPCIDDVLQRSASTLRNLEVTSEDRFSLRDSLAVSRSLARLSRLTLRDLGIDSRNVSLWPRQCPVLESLVLDGVWVAGGNGFEEWRPFFDVLRDRYGRGQGRRLAVKLKIKLAWASKAMVAFRHMLPDVATYGGDDESRVGTKMEHAKIGKMLSNYASGLGEWRVRSRWRVRR